MFGLFILLVITATATIPLWLRLFGLRPTFNGPLTFLPVIAAALFLVSYSLPNPIFVDQTNTFVQHFVGGGLYTACLYVYFSSVFKWRFSVPISLLLLFGWVSAFGAANELFELLLNQLAMTNINLRDTNWDILANTLGAFVGYGLLRALSAIRRSYHASTA